MKKLRPEQARERITAQILKLNAELNEDLLTFYVEKLVAEVLAYCHIRHFPEPLVYAAAEAVLMTLNELESGTISSTAPLSKIKQDDTEFTFAVSAVSAGASFSDLVFENLKPKLNLFRRLLAF